MNPFPPSKDSTSAHPKMARLLSIASVCAFSLAFGSKALAENACNRQAVALLKKYSPSGYDGYRATRDKSVFNEFSADCSDQNVFLESGVTTALHETIHAIRGEQNSYHLISGELLKVPPASNYFAPALLVPTLAKNPLIKDDDYFQTYLSNSGQYANNSRVDITYLLDELNAFTNSMRAQIDLLPVHALTNREAGVPSLMTFVAAYAAYARAHSPSVWKDLSAAPASPTRVAFVKLWAQAEKTLQLACHIAPTSPHDDSVYLTYLCDPSRTEAISMILGRAPNCPRECSRESN